MTATRSDGNTGLRAIVVGAGFAGEGHTIALQQNGVAVEAICSRTAPVVEAVAARLGVPRASTDWRATLKDLKPEIVAVATPAGAHAEIVEAALEQGCHVFCDKPLAPTAPVARQLYERAQQAGVKHAYAATHRYDPSVAWLAELVRDGAIGRVGEVEATFRRHVNPLTPWSWYDGVALGGGLLHNALPHWLGILQRVLGGDLLATTGETRVVRQSAPYVPDIHDFRRRGAHQPTPEQARRLEWRPCDADSAFTALFRFGYAGSVGSPDSSGSPGPAGATDAPATTHDANQPAPSAEPDQPSAVQVSISATGYPAFWPPHGFRFHGTGGTLRADGHFSYTVSRHRPGDPLDSWEPLPVPQRLLAQFPAVGDEFQRKWTALARDFVADILGHVNSTSPYLTFRDGWRFQEAFDAIRAGTGWTTIPQHA